MRDGDDQDEDDATVGPSAPSGLSSAAFRQLAELAPDGLIAHSGGKVVWINEAAATMTGLAKPADAVGLPVLDFVAPESRALVTARIQNMATTGQRAPLVDETFIRRDDGARVELEVAAAPVVEGLFVVAIRDVTARKAAERERARAEALLEDRQRRYRELFDQVPVGVWEEDLSGPKAIVDGLLARGVSDLRAHFRAHPEEALACAATVRVLDVNATACSMVRARDCAELLQNLHRVFLPEAMGDFGEQLAQMAAGREVTLVEGWNGTLDGDRRWVVVRGVVAAGHEHDWSRVVITTVDVTEQRQAREEKALLQEQLRHAEKLEAVGRLAGGVAHDFNNILAAILGFAESSLEEAVPGAPLHENQLHIREAAQRARDLVRQILTFGQRDRPEPKPVDSATVVGEALALARASIPATVELVPSLDAAAGTVLADRTQLHQIVLNLCSNARDAVGPTGRIEVTLSREDAGAEMAEKGEFRAGRYVRLRVRDDGVGMDEATRARLFEPYLTTKGRSGGHGLGLAVVHGIVTASGGSLRVQSAVGRGTTFDVYLPRLDVVAAPIEVAAVAPKGGERILLVDDEPLVRSAHRRVLQSLGYTVTEAPDGLEALELVRRSPGAFDLVFTDQSMPRLGGAELARQLHAEKPALRVLLCTGYSDTLDEAEARRLGVGAVLTKPIDRLTLATTLRALLSGAALE
jgi:PAS domain S-box-containing protein